MARKTTKIPKVKTEVEENVTSNVSNEENQSSISIVDIQNVLQIIDVAAQRGAFRGNELTQVGTVRDKISNFLEENMPPAEDSKNE